MPILLLWFLACFVGGVVEGVREEVEREQE